MEITLEINKTQDLKIKRIDLSVITEKMYHQAKM